MLHTALGRWLGLVALLTLATGITAQHAHAISIGVLPTGGSYSDAFTAPGPTFSKDYEFTLIGPPGDLTILAQSLGQTSPDRGVDNLEISLFDASSNLIAFASGAPEAFFDSYAQSHIKLSPGNYLFTIFGDVTAGKEAFISVSLAATTVTPIPAAGVMMLTACGVLGGLVLRRRFGKSDTRAA